MSVNALETLFWRVTVNHEDAEKFRTDRGSYIAEFRLTEWEKKLAEAFDVKSLHEHGVGCMLLMMAFSHVNGFDKLGDYMAAMAGSGAASAAGEPARSVN